MSDEITLDTFFASETPQEVIDVAAAVGTEVVTDGDSVWRGERFGSSIEELRALANPELAIELEIARVIEAVGIPGEVTVTAGRESTTLRFVEAHLEITV